MGNMIWSIVGTLLFIGFAGGLGYLAWLKFKPKKIIFKAKIYVKNEGVLPPIKDKRGNIISDIRLQDLKPYAKDIIEKEDKEAGISVYRLKTLNKAVPPVTSDVIDFWGKDDKEVHVLLEDDCCTLLKKGYNKDAGIIFNPLPHDRMNMVVNQIAIRKDRLKEAKSALEAIAPFVKATMWVIGMVLITWILVNGYLEMNETTSEAQKYVADSISATYDRVDSTQLGTRDLGIQPTADPPPLLEG